MSDDDRGRATMRAGEVAGSAEELQCDPATDPPPAVVPSRTSAAVRSAQTAKEGYRHAAAAERAAARGYDDRAEAIEHRAATAGADRDALLALAARHRARASAHLQGAEVSERLAALTDDWAHDGDPRSG
jgi:hypothetical protein